MTNFKLSLVQKICLAGIFIPMVAIFQKIFAINYIPVIPFLRISFGGPALIILASIILGPWFGLLVGAFSDLVGFFLFDPRMFGAVPFFQITAIYALLGFGSYFVFKLVEKIKNNKLMLTIELATFGAIFLGITLFTSLNSSIELYGATYELGLVQKIVIPLLTFILLSLLALIMFLMNKYLKKSNSNMSIYHISFSCFVVEILIMLIFGTIMKVWAFSSTTFLAIFFSQLLVSFVNINLNTFLLSILLNIVKKTPGLNKR